MAYRNGDQHGDKSAIGAGRFLGENSAAVVAGGHQPYLGVTHHGEAIFHGTHQRQVSMPIGINSDALIPGRHKHEPDLLLGIAARQLGKIHVAADFDTDVAGRLRGVQYARRTVLLVWPWAGKNRDSCARRGAGFPRRNGVMLAVDSLDRAGCGVEPAFVVTRVIGDVDDAKKNLDIGSACRALKKRVYLW
jgi:hypothetical protein